MCTKSNRQSRGQQTPISQYTCSGARVSPHARVPPPTPLFHTHLEPWRQEPLHAGTGSEGAKEDIPANRRQHKGLSQAQLTALLGARKGKHTRTPNTQQS